MKTTKALRAVQSRRERPAKPALTRQGIITSALSIMREEGLEKVTMRHIAEALDTGAASLYVYVQNVEDLHVQILDELLKPIFETHTTKGTWQQRLKKLLTDYTLVLFQQPEIARMAMSTQPSGPHYILLIDTLLALLNEGGVPDREAAWAVDLLLMFATATAVEHSLPRPSHKSPAEESALALEIASLDEAMYPQIARLGIELLSGTGPDRFQWGIDVLLAGIVHTPRTALNDK